MIKPVCEGSKRKRFDLGLSFLPRVAVGHHPCQVGDFGNPTAVVLLLKLNAQHVVPSVSWIGKCNVFHRQ